MTSSGQHPASEKRKEPALTMFSHMHEPEDQNNTSRKHSFLSNTRTLWTTSPFAVWIRHAKPVLRICQALSTWDRGKRRPIKMPMHQKTIPYQLATKSKARSSPRPTRHVCCKHMHRRSAASYLIMLHPQQERRQNKHNLYCTSSPCTICPI